MIVRNQNSAEMEKIHGGDYMRICSFSVKNYRSITRAYKVPFYDKSILIGPNNEGKSNILHGLVLVLRTLHQIAFKSIRDVRHIILEPSYFRRGLVEYDWERDFPIPLQNTEINGSSDFTIEFELNSNDKEDFRKIVKSHLVTNLTLKLNFYRDRIHSDVVIPGRAKRKLEKKYSLISKFLRTHINLQYIPAVRTTDYVVDIVENLLSHELALLEDDSEYKHLIDKIEKMQKPVLKKLAVRLSKSISEFVSDVKEVEIDTKTRLRRAIRRSCRVLVDDGTKTDLEQKGDGLKSLIAISLVKHSSRKSAVQRNLILAIEEPESHLHPAAIHRLSAVLNDISSKQQVIITTHSPLLIDRVNIGKNILVHKSKAQAAKNITQIRDILGVQVSDNLISANWVLLVEGPGDKMILSTWLKGLSPKLKEAFDNGRIIIDDLQGGNNLAYKLTQYKGLLCNTIAYLDNDKCGRDAFDGAKSKGLITYSEVIFATCPGKAQSEIEDLIKPDVYFDAIKNHFSIRLNVRLFKDKKKKWSDRIAIVFKNQGKPWDDKIKAEVKRIVTEMVVQVGLLSLNKYYANSIKSLITTLKSKMKL